MAHFLAREQLLLPLFGHSALPAPDILNAEQSFALVDLDGSLEEDQRYDILKETSSAERFKSIVEQLRPIQAELESITSAS